MGHLHVFYFTRFDVCKSCRRFYKGLLWSYLNDLGLIKPDGLSWRRGFSWVLKEGQGSSVIGDQQAEQASSVQSGRALVFLYQRGVYPAIIGPTLIPWGLILSFSHLSYHWTPGLPTPYPTFQPKCGPKHLPFTTSDTNSFQNIIELLNQNKWEINLENTP